MQALSLFHQAVSEGHFRQQRWDSPDVHRAEVNLHAMTAGVAMLSLYTWLIALKQVAHRLSQRLTTHGLRHLALLHVHEFEVQFLCQFIECMAAG